MFSKRRINKTSVVLNVKVEIEISRSVLCLNNFETTANFIAPDKRGYQEKIFYVFLKTYLVGTH